MAHRHANDIRRPGGPQKNSIKKRPARRFSKPVTRPLVKSARRIVAQARLAESGRRRTGGPGVESGHHLRDKRDRRRRCRAQSCLSRRGDAAKSRRKLRICNGERTNCLDQREKELVLFRTSRHGADCINKALCLGNAVACAGREARNGTRRRCCLCMCERNGSAKRQGRNQQRPFKHNEPLKWIGLGKSARKILYILHQIRNFLGVLSSRNPDNGREPPARALRKRATDAPQQQNMCSAMFCEALLYQIRTLPAVPNRLMIRRNGGSSPAILRR